MTAALEAPVRVPVVLPVVEVRVGSDGSLDVAVDRKPYAVSAGDARMGRDALRRLVEEITGRLGPVRVQITESDGTAFTDIATPSEPTPHAPETPPAQVQVCPGVLSGHGFLPDEAVEVAVIITHTTAHPDGTAGLRLPPALLADQGSRLVLLGRTSGTVAWPAPAPGVGGEG